MKLLLFWYFLVMSLMSLLLLLESYISVGCFRHLQCICSINEFLSEKVFLRVKCLFKNDKRYLLQNKKNNVLFEFK